MNSSSQKNYAQYKRSAQLSGLELLTARFEKHRFTPHFHDGYAIGICESGSLSFKCNGRTHTAYKNDLMVVYPGDVHEGDCNGIRRYRMIYPDAKIMSDLMVDAQIDLAAPPSVRSPVISDPEIGRWFVQAHQAAEVGDSTLGTQSNVFIALTKLFSRHGSLSGEAAGSISRTDPRILRAVEYIDEHYADEIALKQLSAISGLSPFYLLRNFKAVTGFSPHSYQLYRRVRIARDMLLTEKDTSEIAIAVGFYDQSHFVNRFRSVFGFTPQKFRDEVGSDRRHLTLAM